jgi:hypothetical protein
METVLEVAALDHMVGDGEIDEVDSSKVKRGQPVLLRVDAHAETALRGKVESIATIVQRQSQANPSRIVKLTIELDRTAELPLRPGMRFRGRVETGRLPAAVMVQAEASPPAGRWRSADPGRRAEKVHPRLGPKGDSAIQVPSRAWRPATVPRSTSRRPGEEAAGRRRAGGRGRRGRLARGPRGRRRRRLVPTAVVVGGLARRITAEGNLKAVRATPVTSPPPRRPRPMKIA